MTDEEFDRQQPPRAPITGITISPEILFALTDGCQAALDAEVVSDELGERLAWASAELAARKFNRGPVIAFTPK
jgi:hypothetical protein